MIIYYEWWQIPCFESVILLKSDMSLQNINDVDDAMTMIAKVSCFECVIWLKWDMSAQIINDHQS